MEIKSLQSTASLVESKRKNPAEYQSPDVRISTSEIIASCEITPPEKKRKMRVKGEYIADALKALALDNGEDVFSMLGDIASQDVKSDIASMLVGANNVMFSQLGPREALDVVLFEENKSNLFASIRVPDWVYLLAKVRMRISDAAWQTLLNLTQLGRTGVSNRRININD